MAPSLNTLVEDNTYGSLDAGTKLVEPDGRETCLCRGQTSTRPHFVHASRSSQVDEDGRLWLVELAVRTAEATPHRLTTAMASPEAGSRAMAIVPRVGDARGAI